MIDRHQVGEHPAHRGADDVSALDAERVHKAHSVVSHVIERIGNMWASPGHDLHKQRARVWSDLAHEMGRLADVAVVEPDDPKPFGRQSLAQRIRPEDELGAEAHDEQDQWVAVASEAFIFDIDSIGSNVRHGGPLAPLSPHRKSKDLPKESGFAKQ